MTVLLQIIKDHILKYFSYFIILNIILNILSVAVLIEIYINANLLKTDFL